MGSDFGRRNAIMLLLLSSSSITRLPTGRFYWASVLVEHYKIPAQ
jgi:hypothetical protein